jgi:hypothetical protein
VISVHAVHGDHGAFHKYIVCVLHISLLSSFLIYYAIFFLKCEAQSVFGAVAAWLGPKHGSYLPLTLIVW